MPIFLYINVGYKFFNCAEQSGLWISVEKANNLLQISKYPRMSIFLGPFLFLNT
jgi:hypothetical protein